MTDVPLLHSYVAGQWTAAGGPGRTLVDATTAEPVATLPNQPADAARALDHARTVGGPALREMTFTERASVLRALAKYLSAQVDELVALSTRTGATRRDTAVDVDGGIGTVAVYASKGERELPNTGHLLDGPVEPLGKTGLFAGRHILTPRLGAAVQVNAFNFPVWGMLEKFAPAFLAGMPSVVKPATVTAYLTATAVRMMAESELLPAGALSLVLGSPGQLIDGLTAQDTLGFTGSAATALALRTHPVVAGRSVAFNAEADSLNCSIMAPDVTAADPEFALFVDQLVTEMTVKAGQKCTAIRRAFVPAALADAVTEAVVAQLGNVRVGDPGDPDTVLGPLAGTAERDEVRAAVQSLRADAALIFGDPERVGAHGVDAERGAFLSPLLLRAAYAHAPSAHRVEAFGPVSTLLPYTSTDELIEAVALGGGSLAGSIVAVDSGAAAELVSALAPWHGRLLLLDRTDAAESTGHGVAMPQMLHGGPGRAGGGQELGGLRAVEHYLQRTALQGSPEFLATFDRQ